MNNNNMPAGFEVPGQPPKHLAKCPHPSMMPLGFRWSWMPDGSSVLAVIEAHCFGCGAHINFNPPTERPKPQAPSEEKNGNS